MLEFRDQGDHEGTITWPIDFSIPSPLVLLCVMEPTYGVIIIASHNSMAEGVESGSPVL